MFSGMFRTPNSQSNNNLHFSIKDDLNMVLQKKKELQAENQKANSLIDSQIQKPLEKISN